MNTILPIVIIILSGALLSLILIRLKKRNGPVSPIASKRSELKLNHVSEIMGESGYDLAIFNDHGFKVLESREIDKIPARAHILESSDSANGRIKHLVADLFKGVASVPNKTIEVVFKPEIHQGLANGTYTLMKTASREVLADAVDASNKVVGKGRLIESGKAKQLASSAFQLVSIAVAQSHLADIETTLSAIQDSISEILAQQENEDNSRITGAIAYLGEIAAHMKEFRCPDELPQQKRNTIEGIIKDSYSWRTKLEDEMKLLIDEISRLTDLDTFGTGKTNERLLKFIKKIEPYLKRRDRYLKLALAINIVTAYLDPSKREYSNIDVNMESWKDLMDQFKKEVEKKSKLMDKAICNSQEMLQLRKDKIVSLSNNYHRSGNDQQTNYLALRSSLTENMSRLIDSSGNVRIAISFDNQGKVGGAAIL